ncbi:LOW QUALITY PROTEIN: hypothetical protein KUTeg_022568 [Tegillarca granosa]|uniref:PiggyBac transposable element-derived protein domain-containing protein n=1 Tax=Tegillarca granosa TaxID=220873 RepID=A0ABQ9E9E5_TEGGR|nr:LOW QUALITY PROTEIN: hypothetical protein KUTeg_022568 [Tegillarca granosa]
MDVNQVLDQVLNSDDESVSDINETKSIDSDISFSSPESDSSSEEESVGENIDEQTWSRNLRKPKVTEFSEVGATFELGPEKNELDFLSKFFPTTLVERLVTETNNYADKLIIQKPDKGWIPTFFQEMMAFLGIHVIFFRIQNFLNNYIKKTFTAQALFGSTDVACPRQLKRKTENKSTYSDPTQKRTVQRRQKDGTKKDVSAPGVSGLYNKYMFGVDIADQKRMQYSTCRKAKKWYKYLFWFCFDLAVVNSLVCMQESPNHKLKTKTNREKKIPNRIQTELGTTDDCQGTRKRKAPSVTDNCGMAHWPIQFDKPGRCKNCSKEGKRHEMAIGCRQCKIRLCIKFDCFYKYHQELLN